jgi:SAM-dependent methyltransferase
MDRYYPAQYRGYSGLTQLVLRCFYRWRVGSWVKGAGAPGDVLEVGCGPGFMLDALRRRGWRTMGVERTDAMAAAARDGLGLEVVVGNVEDIPPDRLFDLIVMFQVLEHMPSPQAVLAACAARLKPGGRLIVAVPNAGSWQARFGGRYWVHLDPPRHVFHFTPAALRRQFERVGLTVTSTRFISPEHDPYGWVESAISRITRRPNVMTRFLMGLDAASPRALASVAAAAALAVPALILSAVSWGLGRGAIMEITGRRPRRAIS